MNRPAAMKSSSCVFLHLSFRISYENLFSKACKDLNPFLSACRNCDSSDGGENCRAGANAAPLFDPSDLEADDAYSFDIIPIMYEDNGTSYMSFNEIQFQLMGDEAEVQRDIISAAVAGIIGERQAGYCSYCISDFPTTVEFINICGLLHSQEFHQSRFKP